MKKINWLLTACLLSWTVTSAQQNAPPAFLADSSDTRPLHEVVVKAYEQNRKLIDVGAPVAVIGKASLDRFAPTSILPAMNLTPGVRMEERSPGSYRLNIRGSSIRSPFGVRDIKIYYNEIPLTDPGGNTYLNELGFYNFQSLEVIKGTAGSLYGAGIGGAVLIGSMPAVWEKGLTVDYTGGSYATSGSNMNLRLGDADHRTILSYDHQTSNGYRQQTRMRRDIGSWETMLRPSDIQSIHAYVLYSDLYYQTPGGLTETQYNQNPREARPPAGASPGAVQAKAAIFQKNFTAGISSTWRLGSHWQNTTAVYGAYTDFTNPGIRVYENRQEPHFGGRTVVQYKTDWGASALQINGGAEAQKGFFETRDYANSAGDPAALQTDDKLNTWTYMTFAQADLKLPGGWTITGGASLNVNALNITATTPTPAVTNKIRFSNKLAPRLALLKKILPDVSVYASASRGFSTPTVQELQKSNGIVGPPLQPENGTDFELGGRGSFWGGRLFVDIDGFIFHINNAIVQRIDTNGVAYSVNAGGTNQHGIETFVSWRVIDLPKAFCNSLRLFVSDAWHDFHYSSFTQDTGNFSGHRLPSVPPQTIILGMDLSLHFGLYANGTYTYTDRIALNDANTFFAGSYNLLAGRIGFRKVLARWKGDVYAGVDNAADVKYSLGDDFNAAANRFYNAAPAKNFYAGVSLNYLFR
ncbi:MAG TPA: TonB-dependent receptor [Puia sp.]|nr:TonB-dependent receptor [Puia sp.]